MRTFLYVCYREQIRPSSGVSTALGGSEAVLCRLRAPARIHAAARPYSCERPPLYMRAVARNHSDTHPESFFIGCAAGLRLWCESQKTADASYVSVFRMYICTQRWLFTTCSFLLVKYLCVSANVHSLNGCYGLNGQ